MVTRGSITALLVALNSARLCTVGRIFQTTHSDSPVFVQNNSGGISLDDIIAWVHGAPHNSEMQAFRGKTGALMVLHLGSVENGWLYFQKKVGAKGLKLLTCEQFDRGLRCLLELSPDHHVWAADTDLVEHFNKAGARQAQSYVICSMPPAARPAFHLGSLRDGGAWHAAAEEEED